MNQTNRFASTHQLGRLASAALVISLLCIPWLASAEPVTLSFYFRGGDLQSQLVERWITEFERDNPDIRIDWHIATGLGDLPVLIASGVGPDIIEMWGASAKDLADNGFLLDLNPYIERDFTEDEVNDFFPTSWAAGELIYGPRKGMRYGVPSYANLFIMYYNQTMFAEAGVPYLSDLNNQGNWTWDTLVEIGKKLTRRDANNNIVQWGLDDDSFHQPTARGSAWIHAAGGQVFDFPNNPTRFMLDQPPAIYALQFLQDLIWTHNITPPMNDRAQAHFHRGKSAMNLWMATAWLNRIEDTVAGSFEWDMAPRPVGPGGTRSHYLASDMFGISANTKHPEEAWRFVQYLTSQAGGEADMQIMGRAPVRRSLYPLYAELYSDKSTIYFAEGMMDSVLSPETFMENVNEARALIVPAVADQIMPNNMPADQAIREIAGAVRALYE